MELKLKRPSSLAGLLGLILLTAGTAFAMPRSLRDTRPSVRTTRTARVAARPRLPTSTVRGALHAAAIKGVPRALGNFPTYALAASERDLLINHAESAVSRGQSPVPFLVDHALSHLGTARPPARLAPGEGYVGIPAPFRYGRTRTGTPRQFAWVAQRLATIVNDAVASGDRLSLGATNELKSVLREGFDESFERQERTAFRSLMKSVQTLPLALRQEVLTAALTGASRDADVASATTLYQRNALTRAINALPRISLATQR